MFLDHHLLFWGLAIVASFLVGASKGGLPGVGILSVPIMVVDSSITAGVAAGLLLPIYIVSDIYGLMIYRKQFDMRNLAILVPAATLGIVVGWLAAEYTSDNLVKLSVAIIGLWYCADQLWKRYVRKSEQPARRAEISRGIFWGSIAGFTSFVAHAGGTALQMYALPQKLPKMVYAGTATIAFAIINLLKLPPYILIGQVNFASIWTCLILSPVAVFGAWAGYELTKRLPEKIFFRFVEIALFLLSLKLIYDVVVD
jgi:uncharacterized protein